MSTERFGPYDLLRLIGRGGMGEVFEAYDTEQDRTVALKRLVPHMAHDEEFQARFRRESKLAARLRSPHVVPIHRFGEIDGQLYIDMRLVEGCDLEQLLTAEGPLAPSRAVAIIEQVAWALDAAHHADLIHRDIKPSNVLLDNAAEAHEFVYLADFGITRVVSGQSASLTSTNAILGSLDYMAPEQFDGLAAPPVDIYSLGCLLFHCLAGRKPFPVEGFPAMMRAHLTTPAPLPSQFREELGEAFDEVVVRAMAKEPDERYASAGALAVAARAALTEAPATDPDASEARTVIEPRALAGVGAQTGTRHGGVHGEGGGGDVPVAETAPTETVGLPDPGAPTPAAPLPAPPLPPSRKSAWRRTSGSGPESPATWRTRRTALVVAGVVAVAVVAGLGALLGTGVLGGHSTPARPVAISAPPAAAPVAPPLPTDVGGLVGVLHSNPAVAGADGPQLESTLQQVASTSGEIRRQSSLAVLQLAGGGHLSGDYARAATAAVTPYTQLSTPNDLIADLTPDPSAAGPNAHYVLNCMHDLVGVTPAAQKSEAAEIIEKLPTWSANGGITPDISAAAQQIATKDLGS